MKSLPWTFLAFSLLLPAQRANPKHDNRSPRMVANCRGENYGLEAFDRGTAVNSPDRKRSVFLGHDGSFSVREGTRLTGIIRVKYLSSNVSVYWAPDSRKFAIFYSDGGAIGAFHTLLYQVRGARVSEILKPTQVAYRDLTRRYFCKARGANNILFGGWTPNSKLAFLAVQVYPTSDCAPVAGKYGGYLMDMQGRIVAHYGDKETSTVMGACWKSGRASLQ